MLAQFLIGPAFPLSGRTVVLAQGFTVAVLLDALHEQFGECGQPIEFT